MPDPTTASATELARAIRDGELSSLEAVEACLRRIDAVNPTINAVAVVDNDRAFARAAELDQALARGEVLGSLHGVPFTVKDWIETNDAVCAANFPERAAFVPKRDATVVRRMRAAGGVFIGKTVDGDHNTVYGPCYNPYDLSRTPGLSSAGEAAVIAVGGSPVGLGSDSGGSIRYPAHCCGVAGLKPSAGRVPLTGHFPRIGSLSDPRTQIGPLARRVEDLALILPIIAGPDGRDPSVAPVPLGGWRDIDVSSLRIATFTGFDGASCTLETAATVRDAARALTDGGATVDEAVPPRIEESRAITHAYWARPSSAAWNEWQAGGRESTLSADEIERSIFAWERLQREMLAFMEHYDVIVCPASPAPAGPHDAPPDDLPFIYTLPFSLSGQPVAVVRAGMSPEGLPIGVQVVARMWRDDVALAAAHHIEAALGGWQPPPL